MPNLIQHFRLLNRIGIFCVLTSLTTTLAQQSAYAVLNDCAPYGTGPGGCAPGISAVYSYWFGFLVEYRCYFPDTVGRFI